MNSEIKHPRQDEIAELLGKAEQLVQNNLKSCLSCGFFREKNGETCTAYPGPPARPPARVIAFGCPAYEFIPF